MRITFKNFEDGAVLETSGAGGKSTYELAASNAQSVVSMMAMVAIGERQATAESVRKAMLDAVGHLRKQIVDAEVVEDKP